MRLQRQLAAIVFFVALQFAPSGVAQTQPVLESVEPAEQRVHEFIVLRGSGFGDTQGASTVLFQAGQVTIASGKAYQWRDEMIRVRVPVGNRIGRATVPIPAGPVEISVRTLDGESQALPFRVIVIADGTLQFRQLTNIDDDVDSSAVLGSPNLNAARTKDTELGDVNGDGFTDLIDNNSNNEFNDSHSVLRLNTRSGRFRAIRLEPLHAEDVGTFATTIEQGGDFFGNHTSYDADLVDIDNDGFLDLIQTAADNTSGQAIDNRLRFLINNAGLVPGRFVEQTAGRLPPDVFGEGGCPDDLDHADINNDGNVDFLVTLRTAPQFCTGSTSRTLVFVNEGGGTFDQPITLSAPDDISTHDAFFLDANNDGFEDVVLCNEWNTAANQPATTSQLFLHNGDAANPEYALFTTLPGGASTGGAADLNGDGLVDFVTARSEVRVFLNDPTSPGSFSSVVLVSGVGRLFYDIEMGDLDLDGAVDIVAANLTTDADETVRIWLNDGQGTFTEATAGGAGNLLPGIGGYQRLSADLLDLDEDGDLDLYVSGADGVDAGPGNGLGRSPNQLYENVLADSKLAVTSRVLPFGDPGRFSIRVDGVLRSGNLGDGESTGFLGVSPGEHTVTVAGGSGTDLGDYVTIIDGDCSADGSVTLDLDERKTCSVSNLAKSPELACRENCKTDRDICLADGILLPRTCVQIFQACRNDFCPTLPVEPQLTVTKELRPADDIGRFDITIDGVTVATGVGDGGTTGPQTLSVGAHTVGETASGRTDLDDYTTAIGGSCSPSGDVLLAGGERKTCTILNSARPRLEVRLNVSPVDDPGRFNVQVDGVTRLSNADHGSATGAFVVSPGVHTVTQTAASGTNLSDYRTFFGGDCAINGRVTLAQGDSKTCVVSNLAEAGQDCEAQCREERDICMDDRSTPPQICVQLFNVCLATCN